MAKGKKSAKNGGGPYLAAAFFCEQVIEDKSDGALSAIRIIDSITVTLPPNAQQEMPSEEHPIPVHISGVLSFKTGGSPGEHTIRLVMHSPSGKSGEVFKKAVSFSEKPQGGANIRLKNVINVQKGGLFWLHVFLDGRRVTRMPLVISTQRASDTTSSQTVDKKGV